MTLPGVCPHCLYPVEYRRRRAYNWDTVGARHHCDYMNGEPITRESLRLNERDWAAMQAEPSCEPSPAVAPSESTPRAAEPSLRVVE